MRILKTVSDISKIPATISLDLSAAKFLIQGTMSLTVLAFCLFGLYTGKVKVPPVALWSTVGGLLGYWQKSPLEDSAGYRPVIKESTTNETDHQDSSPN